MLSSVFTKAGISCHKRRNTSEILEDLRDWHKTYVPDHEFGSHKEEEDARPRGYMRHIHINHGPELERSIEEVKKKSNQSKRRHTP